MAQACLERAPEMFGAVRRERLSHGSRGALLRLATVVLASEQTLGEVVTQQPLRKILFTEELAQARGAQCLDHTPAGYYLREGDPSKWVIFLEGGGLCLSPVDCAKRAESRMGSSSYWKDELGGYMTTSVSSLNPFGLFSQVHVPYCSGDTWLGAHARPHLGLMGFQMSGHLILETVLEHLANETGITSAASVVLSGTSAGGIGTFHSADWFGGRLAALSQARGHAPPKFVAMPIAGIFFPINFPVLFEVFELGVVTPYDGVASNFVDFLEGPFIHPGCVAAAKRKHLDLDWCFDVGFMMEHVETPLFVLSNRFDAMHINMFGLCPPSVCSGNATANSDGGEFVRFYGQKVNDTVAHLSSKRPSTGFFIPSEFQHDENFGTYFWDEEKAIKGVSLRAAFEVWHKQMLSAMPAATAFTQPGFVPPLSTVHLVEQLCDAGGPCHPIHGVLV
mmetsp:Transcript_54628/g.152479  ORF Transcript_54628/g.152479 Transcript_54628/m.152479 type:complete len:449 (+) Transcript_54628:3-1349(+)